MSTFLDRNKKKSSLAALLLFLRERKALAVLLLAVMFATSLFVGPSAMLLRLPGGTRMAAGIAWIATKLGVDVSKWGLAGQKHDFGDLVAAFKNAKEGSGKAGWGAFMGRGDAGAGAGAGSLDFVKGSKSDLAANGAEGDKLPKPGSVGGILNADDASKRGENGVSVDENEVGKGGRDGADAVNGFVRSAFAGGFANGQSAFGGNGANGGLSGGAYASSGFFSGGKGGGNGGKLGDLVKNGTSGLPGAANGHGVQIQGAAKGQLSKSQASIIQARTARGLLGTHEVNGQRAFTQLAVGRGRAAISVAPNCTAGNGCPNEYASTVSGAVYDGNNLVKNQDIITDPPELPGGIGSPNVPDTSLGEGYTHDAENMQTQAQQCKEADQYYMGTDPSQSHHNPTITQLNAAQEAKSKEFESLGCATMSCSKKNKSKLEQCNRWGDEMYDLCVQSMQLQCDLQKACPLTAGNPTCNTSQCGRRKSGNVHYSEYGGCKVVIPQGGTCPNDQIIWTQTQDDNGVSAQCHERQNQLKDKRQATANALNTYRHGDNPSCEAQYPDRYKDVNHVKLWNNTGCNGKGSSVESTCRALQDAYCNQEHDCHNDNACSRNGDDCKVTNLNDIQELINKTAH